MVAFSLIYATLCNVFGLEVCERTQMSIIITYDISDGHTQVKAECLSVGFEDCLQVNDGTWHRLPNTTLRHPNDDLGVVLAEFKRAVKNAESRIRPTIQIEKIYLVRQGAGFIDSNETCNGSKSQ